MTPGTGPQGLPPTQPHELGPGDSSGIFDPSPKWKWKLDAQLHVGWGEQQGAPLPRPQFPPLLPQHPLHPPILLIPSI